MLDPPLVINLQINLPTGIKDIPFLGFQLWSIITNYGIDPD